MAKTSGKVISRSTLIKPIQGESDSDHLKVDVSLTGKDVSVQLDGKAVEFSGGRVTATYLNVPALKPTIRVVSPGGRVRQTFKPGQLIQASSPFIFACCCCCCCRKATITL